MMFALLTIAAMAATAGPDHRPVAANPICAKTRPRPARAAPLPGMHLLAEEPGADELLAVKHVVGGCDAAAIVRTGIGAPHQ